MSKDFEPIINMKPKKNTSLTQKKVDIKGKTDFSRNNTDQNKTSDNIKKIDTNNVSSIKDSVLSDRRFKATLTQKVSPAVNLKMNTLKPFLGELENMPKATINEIIDLVIDSYVNTRLTTRQQEAFKSMFETQLNMLKK